VFIILLLLLLVNSIQVQAVLSMLLLFACKGIGILYKLARTLNIFVYNSKKTVFLEHVCFV
jgi:hypothetical protein